MQGFFFIAATINVQSYVLMQFTHVIKLRKMHVHKTSFVYSD